MRQCRTLDVGLQDLTPVLLSCGVLFGVGLAGGVRAESFLALAIQERFVQSLDSFGRGQGKPLKLGGARAFRALNVAQVETF